MSTRPSFSLGRALSAAVAILPAVWGGAWGVLILLFALNAYAPLGIGHTVSGVPLIAGVALLSMVVQFMASGALYRVALFGRDARKEGLGFGGFQLGAPELRLFLAELIVHLFGLLILTAVVVVFAIAFNTAGMGEGHKDTTEALNAMFRRQDGKDWIFIIYLIAAAAFLIFVNLKFALMRAATVAQRRLVTLNALGLSSGNVGRLFIGLVIIVLPFFVVAIGLTSIIGKPISAPHHAVSGYFIAHAVVQALAAFVLMPVMIGFLSSAYRQIVASRTT